MTEYTSPYANNIGKMINSEVVCLAKNRFTDEETMLAISKHHYRLGKEYLAKNPNITQEAAEQLWDHKGYVFKSILMSTGSIKLKKKEYAEVYRKHFKGKNRSPWRMFQAFLGNSRYHWQTPGKKNPNNTPAELIEEIYDDISARVTEDGSVHGYADHYNLRRFIQHENCPLTVALKIGTTKTPEQHQGYYEHSFESLRNDAMLKVAEITKRESAVSR